MTHRFSAHEERSLIENLATQPEGFRLLYDAYFPRLFAYVAYRVDSRQDAEDLTADIFMKVVEHIGQFDYRGEGAFAAWLFKIAINRVQQHYRTHAQQSFVALDDLPDMMTTDLLPDDALSQKERFARVKAMLETLSPRRREIISLRFFGELRNQEIATVLGLDERTVASHLARGLEDLQRKYQQEDVQL